MSAGGEEEDKKDLPIAKLAQIHKLMEQLAIKNNKDREVDEEGKIKEHRFWKTQPVIDGNLEEESNGPIKSDDQVISELRKEPYDITSEFEWCILDINNEKDKKDLYSLLKSNYVEDAESLFRFDYPENFLEWALKCPGWKNNWNLCVRVKHSGALVAFISAIPMSLAVRGKEFSAVEVNFLCIHKKLRSKRLAPLMIREITRRVNVEGIYQALYTAGTLLPGLVCKARYYHRPLNYRKLYKVGFTSVPLGKSLESMCLKYYLPKVHTLKNLRPMKACDVEKCYGLFNEYTCKFILKPTFTLDEFQHWILPRDNIIYSYVLCDNEGSITDFISFYSLPSTIVSESSDLNVAYLFYYACSSPKSLQNLVHALLIEAKNMGFDVFNCLDIMDNSKFTDELKFGEGDGYLNYYLYNWETASIDPTQCAVVMI